MKIFNLQMTSKPDVEQNLMFVEQQLRDATEEVAGNLVVLPECFAFFGGKDQQQAEIAELRGEGVIQTELSRLAKTYRVGLVAGSIPIKSEESNKFYNTCFVFDPEGRLVASYDKIHLFDVAVGDNTGQYRESDCAEAGDRIEMFEFCGYKVGVAICYDLRFPGLFQQLRDLGAELVVLPSAFTAKTGNAHWHTLIKARAIENQCYFAGCNQSGEHQNGRRTYGHSLIVDPWGEILADAEQRNGLTSAKLEKERLVKIRNAMPVQLHTRFKSSKI